MAKNLKKFVNPKFISSVDLSLFRRLFQRQEPSGGSEWTAFFNGEPRVARERLQDLFTGPEDALPQGLLADLHRISELGTEHGMILLQSRAARQEVEIRCSVGEGGVSPPLDPKHFAVLAFLDYPEVFNSASDLMALEIRSSVTEYVGADEDVAAEMNCASKAAFEDAAREVFQRDHRGGYCRVGWYDDDDEVNVVVTHGAPVTVRPVINDQEESVISYRGAEHAVLSYHPRTGRLKVGGVMQARRALLAEIFATAMLNRSGFFIGPDSQRLYTLASVESRGLRFTVDHAFDPEISRVQITEVQVDRITTDAATGDVVAGHSIVAKDGRRSALLALEEIAPRGIVFGPNSYRIGHLGLRIHFAVPRGRPVKVTIKLKPPSQAVFKRHRFEGRIMELLRRNGFCHDRDIAETLAAAE